MNNDALAFCFGVHNHQPIGNFEHVLADAAARAYRPFLERLHARPEVRLTVHCTGSLLEWLRDHASPAFDLLGALVGRGQVELLTGGFYETILAILPDHDKHGQIERLSAFLHQYFGVRPRGMWLAERVWEPHLPRALRAAGVEYVLVDDSHFALAGLDPDALGGYYLTEEQGAVLAIFPINQRLRYLVPFAEVEATVEYLGERRGRVPALTLVDDGEKFGVWPGTHAHVYENGWLDRFFDRLLGIPWLELTTFADVVDRLPAVGRVYLPTASYREMGEWALSARSGETLAAGKRALEALADGEELVGLLRGGFWRNFLVKYPEVADCYWKMLRLSRSIHEARAGAPGDARLLAAQLALWRGQANDAYWHGVFGGCYLPHLRRAVKGALLEAERVLAETSADARVAWSCGDGNGDGRDEVLVRTGELAVTVNPQSGGVITELGYLPRPLDLADVLTRRPEAYHARIGETEEGEGPAAARTIHAEPVVKEAGLRSRLAYDPVRRASLTDALVGGDGAVDPVAPWEGALMAFGGTPLGCAVDAIPDGVAVRMWLAREGDAPLGLDKRVTVRGNVVEARYRLRALPGTPLSARWVVQWNLALTAGDAPGRYLDLPGRPSLASSGRVLKASGLALVDEWIGVEARLDFQPDAEVAWGPVETVSLSESGFERIYQGTALVLVWPLDLEPGGERELSAALAVVSR